MTQFTGVVKKVVSKEIDIANKPFIKHEISIDSDGETKTVLKFTKPETTFALEKGTKVQVTGEEQEDKYGNTTIKVNSKPESFVLLDQNNKPKDSGKTWTNTTSTTGTKDVALRPTFNTFNGDGAKRGNALTNAVTMLIHNKNGSQITIKDAEKLLELARMVFKVSTDLENPDTTSSTSTTKDSNNEVSPFD
jgi:hypothetical protein